WVAADVAGFARSTESAVLVALAAVAIIAIVVGIRWYKPRPVWPWWLMLAALVLFFVGDGMRQQLHTLGDLSSHRSLVPDAITIPGYLALAAALGGIARSRGRGRRGDVDAILDGLIAALATMALAWAFLVSPVIDRGDRTLSVEIVLAVYPALSAFL